MRTMISACFICLLATNVGQSGGKTGKYAGNGIAFDHPKTWDAKADTVGGVATITVQNDKGTQASLQVHPAAADPMVVRGVMEATFNKVFAGKLVPGSAKAVKRTVAGAEREGKAMDFELAKDVVLHFEFFAFPLAPQQPVVCVVLQNAAFDAAEARTGFDQIVTSLAKK